MTDTELREAFTKILLTQERLILTIEAFEERISRLEIENSCLKRGVASMSLDTEALVKAHVLEETFDCATQYGNSKNVHKYTSKRSKND